MRFLYGESRERHERGCFKGAHNEIPSGRPNRCHFTNGDKGLECPRARPSTLEWYSSPSDARVHKGLKRTHSPGAIANPGSMRETVRERSYESRDFTSRYLRWQHTCFDRFDRDCIIIISVARSTDELFKHANKAHCAGQTRLNQLGWVGVHLILKNPRQIQEVHWREPNKFMIENMEHGWSGA